MTKKDLDTIEHSMSQADIDQQEIARVIADLKAQIEEAAALREQKEKPLKIKYIIANTTDFNGDPTELPAMVVEAEDEVVWNTVVDIIKEVAAKANNEVRKLKNDPIESVFDAIERVPAKFFKERKMRVISKEMLQILETDNKL